MLRTTHLALPIVALAMLACAAGGPAGRDAPGSLGEGSTGGLAASEDTTPASEAGAGTTTGIATTEGGNVDGGSTSPVADTSAEATNVTGDATTTGDGEPTTSTAAEETGPGGQTAEAGDTAAGQCVDDDLGSMSPTLATGTNVGALDDHQGSCATSTGGADVVYEWTAPAAGDYLLSTIGEGTSFDTILAVFDGCDGTELGCADDYDNGLAANLASMIPLSLDSGQTITIVIDGFNEAATGTFDLSILPVPAATEGETCCISTDGWGCAVEIIEACTCAVDPFCCEARTGAWDSTCVSEATTLCNMAC